MELESSKSGSLTVAVAGSIRALMARDQMTIKAMSDATGMAMSTISRLTRGQRDISLEQLVKIADALGVDPRTLINEWSSQTVDMEAN